MLGTDIGTRAALKAYGGRGFPWLIEKFIPMMREAGISQENIDLATTHNAARARSF